MSLFTPEIFSEKVFGDCSLLKARLTKDPDSGDSPEYTGSMDMCGISIFDYILAFKKDIIPYGEKMYHDWLNCEVMTVSSANWFNKEVVGKHIMSLMEEIPVHELLFYAIDIDITAFYPALVIPPTPYSICCMQWDAYDLFYFISHERMEGAQTPGSINNGHDQLCADERSGYPDGPYISVYRPCMESLTDCHISCVQSDSLIDPISCVQSDSLIDPIQPAPDSLWYIYRLFVSDQGIADYLSGNAYGEYMASWHLVTPIAGITSLNASMYPILRDGISYFSDVYGL